MGVGCSAGKGCTRSSAGALVTAEAAGACSRLVLPPLSALADRQTGPSAVAACRMQAPVSQELGQATKKQTF